MGPLVVLFFFLLLGVSLAAFAFETARSAQVSRILNRWVIRAALPALVLQKIHALPEFSFSSPEILLPVSQPWIHFFLSMALVTVVAKMLRWSRSTWGALVLTLGLGNTSFVGIPLLRAILGPESLGTAVVLDQLGSFLILSAIGAPLAQAVAPRDQNEGEGRHLKSSAWTFLLRPLKFPPFLALLVALASRPFVFPDWIDTVLGAIASTLGPVALVSVGLSMKWKALSKREVRQPLTISLLLKLVLFPLVYWALYSRWAAHYPGFSTVVLKTILLEGSMASMITAGVVAADNQLDPDLAQLMVGVSIPLSLVTVPIWALVF
jgi:predicted permease